MKYNHQKIEKKWQAVWQKTKLYLTRDSVPRKENYYALVEFPYPSGNLHVGHWYAFSVPDIFARFMRMRGKNVLYPIGFDAFGLPAENAAIKRGLNPGKWTRSNIAYMKKQIASMGASFDFTREVVTCDPEYYKWNQWIFSQFFKKSLAYQAETPVNWCPKDKTVLANEQVRDGRCERCDSAVEQRKMKQWQLSITDYAEKLLSGLDKLDWPEEIKESQRNWIGKSEGAEIEFKILDSRLRGNDKPRFVILHGRDGSPTEIFFPTLIEKLRKHGYEVEAPQMPGGEAPNDMEQAEYVRTHCKLDESTIILAHSMGGIVAMRLLEGGAKVNQVILLATPYSGRFLDGKNRSTVTEAAQKGFDFKKIKRQAKSFIALYGINDTAIPLSDGEAFANNLGINLIKVQSERPHFLGNDEPAVLDACLPSIKVFTTRPDTIFGATYMVLAPEHQLVKNLESRIENLEEVEEYIKKTKQKTEIQRTAVEKDKNGVELKGLKAVNPATGEEISVWIADYVLMGYGTGAIMAVPAHDERDFAFAKKYDLPIRQVVAPYHMSPDDPVKPGQPSVFRNALACIVRDPATDKYLCLDWRVAKHWKTFVTGGIEESEDLVAAARREIEEETGYTDLKFVRQLPFEGHDEFFHLVKKENRYARFRCLVFELSGKRQKEVAEAERSQHVPAWVEKDRVAQYVTADVFKYFWQQYTGSETAYTGGGKLINSGKFDRTDSEKSKRAITEFVGGKLKTQYKLRDWVISRQRYWGTPIPVIHCPDCGPQAVPEKDLPVILPEIKDYLPRSDGKSPLAKAEKWMKAKCPKCGGSAERETDTMDTFVDSSWYFLRYTDPKNKKVFASLAKMKKWMPVARYSGGAEHTTMHLLYSRFWIKAMKDLGLVSWDEPYLVRMNRGLILGPDGQKMSKSRGNVVDPDKIVKELGADTVRMYLAFIGPYNEVGSYPWDPKGIMGVRRFLEKVYKLVIEYVEKRGSLKAGSVENGLPEYKVSRQLEKTIKKVKDDINFFKFNTAISSLMICADVFRLEPISAIKEPDIERFLKILAPFAPHLAEELWESLGHKKSIHLESWPRYDEKLLKEDKIKVAVQVGGKLRAMIELSADALEADARKAAEKDVNVSKYLTGAKIRKVVYIKGKIINFVI